MSFFEEETVSTVVEKGTFYTPTTETEFDETPVLQKAMLLILPGILLSLILPLLLPGFILTHFLASVLLFFGFLQLQQENRWFRIGWVLSAVELVWAVWSFLCGNILPNDPLPHAVSSVLPYVAMMVGLGIFQCCFLGLRQMHAPASQMVFIAACAYVLLLILSVSHAPISLLIEGCVALVGLAALIATAIKLHK